MRIRNLLLFTTVLLFTLSCKNKKDEFKEQMDNLHKFREYIASVSQGIISTHSDIRVVLKTPVEGWSAGEELNDDLFRIYPRTKGKVVALNNQTIAFIPEMPLEQDRVYNCTLMLDGIIEDIPSDYEKFTFKLRTIKQQFNVHTSNLHSYSKAWQYMEGTLRAADKMAPETARQLITVTQKGEKIPVKFEETEAHATQFTFKIDSIQRFEEDSEIEIRWDGSPYKIDTKGKETYTIPGKNNFTVMDVSVNDTEGRSLSINFSDPLKKDQDFSGLAAIRGAENLSFSAEGNVLNVYLDEPVKGEAILEIFRGIQSREGYSLKQPFSELIAFEQLKPEVRLLGNGTILPASSNLKINFEAVNLKAVDVSVTRIYENNILQFLQFNELEGNTYLRNVARPVARKTIRLQNNISGSPGKFRAYALDLKTLINPRPGDIYRVEFNIRPDYSLYDCESTNFNTEENTPADNEEEDMRYWDDPDFYYDYYYDDEYDWRQRENPCHTSYYRNKKVALNVLASDLGVTIKKGANEKYWVSVNDIVTTQPRPGTRITFYNLQQQALGSVVTGNKGMAEFDSEHPAYFAIAEKNEQKTYVKLNDGKVLSVSRFDVAGAQTQKGLKGYLYGERGVWRPGDTLFLSFMLNDKSNDLPENHPVKFELSDPYGKITRREIRYNSLNNLYTFITTTDANAPTGNWTAKVSVGGAGFSKNIRIETVKPNRLRIRTGFEADMLSGSAPINGTIEVSWLHGAVAKNLKADINARFTPQTTTFSAYPGYVFDDPARKFSPEEQTVFEGSINAAGKASFKIQPQLSGKAPGMLKAAFITKVYENGGDFSTDVFTKTYSPYPTYIGLKVPEADKERNMLLTDTEHTFGIVTVDENGKPKPVKNLNVSIHKVQWRWWWDTSSDNLSSYTGSNYREKVFSTTLSTGNNGKATFNFELKYPGWGRYLVRVEDPEGGHATGQLIYIDWPGWAGKSRKDDPSAATMLVFSTDKKTYNVGEKAIVTFPSSEAGRALVTVENGSEVLQSMWVTPQKGETKFELPISETFTPNIFIHITLLQPHASTANDLPIRLYGVIPVMVENPETKLEPQITMPGVLRPEETVTVQVSERNKKAMTYSIAMVDEGLLDLTRFKTPDPWETFYAREALGIKTWDIYDEVIGAYGGRIDQVFAIGGDEDLAGARNKKANRFKPMVVYLGPFSLKPGKTNAHKITIPKYVGSVRTMVVAGNPDTGAYGSAEKTTPVRKPLMVLASLPRKITPGEKVTLPVTVFAMENKVKNVTVSLKKNKAYKITGNTSQKVTFSQPDEKMVYFDLEVTDITGIGKVAVEASGNGEKASYEVEIDVVNPNPLTTSVQDVMLEPNAQASLKVETFGIPGSNEAQIEFSSLPPMNFTGRLQYLIRYPHGCVEQIASAAFPQLYLDDIFDLTYDKKKTVQRHIKDAMNRLNSYQLPNGGFSYWPGRHEADDWGTSYAGHFLLEAEKKGYVLPIGFKSSWISYQQQAAKQWRKGPYTSDLAQAYRLYTLALAGSAEVSSMNRLREMPDISNEARHRLAAAYALIGRKSAAQQLFASARIDFQPVKYEYYTYGSVERNRAMALETLILLGDKTKARDLGETVAKSLDDDRWMSTQTIAYSLLAMARYADFIGGKGVSVSYTFNGKQETITSQQSLASRALGIKAGENGLSLKNNGDNTLFVRVISSGILPVGEEKTVQRNLKAIVAFKGRNGKNLTVSPLSQGTDFIAEVTITNRKGEAVKNIALTEIFPGGWEIVNTRFTDFGSFAQNEADYTDIRDDRIHFYFDLEKYESKTFRVLLNASYPGTYYLPGIQCEAMYDNDFAVRTKGQWVEVTQN